MFQAFVERFIEADDHGGSGAQAGCKNRTLRFEILPHRVLEFTVARTETLGEDLRSAAGDPTYAGAFQTFGGCAIVEFGVIGQVHKLSHGKRIEFHTIAISLANGGKQIAIVAERQVRIETAIESRKIAAEGEQLVNLCEDLITAHHIAFRMTGKTIKRTVIALRDTHVCVIDDAHDQIRAIMRLMKTRAYGG